MLRAESLTYEVAKKMLLQPTTVAFEQGIFHVIMGANGAGKSTLLKLLAGELKPTSGNIWWKEKQIGAYSKKELALRRAVLSQHYNISFPITVQEIVMMGRYPHFGSNPRESDQAICQQAMELMNVLEFAERDYNTLSGGEAQKVQMSRVLAQVWVTGQEKMLFLDEPVSHLDVRFQHQLLHAAKDWCNNHTTVIAILHDVNLALAFADRILFMKQGSIVHDLKQPEQVSTEMIHEVFDMPSYIIYPDGHKPVIIF